jgi:hypothetical protein
VETGEWVEMEEVVHPHREVRHETPLVA